MSYFYRQDVLWLHNTRMLILLLKSVIPIKTLKSPNTKTFRCFKSLDKFMNTEPMNYLRYDNE